MQKLSRLALLALASTAVAQSNAVAGMDGWLTNIQSLTYYGRRGSAHPNGEIGMAFANTMCNPGSVEIPWYAAMQEDHPKFSFIMTRETNGRMVQINDWRSYLKHAFTSVNVNGACGTCAGSSAGGSKMGLNCSDTYGASNNGDRYWLGPPEEVDPFLGTWESTGSWFDLAGNPANPSDGVRTLTSTIVSSWGDSVRNRLTVKEQDFLVPNSKFFYGIQLIHQGEPMANRANNIASRGFVPTWNGTTWSFSTTGQVGFTQNTVLSHWTGASVSSAYNGSGTTSSTIYDGKFYVAVKVTGPVNGKWHYEYAVQNYDNMRGAVIFALPVCDSAQVTNLGFRDLDSDALNDWTVQRANGELRFLAGANNKLRWNNIFNFWFDSDAAPVTGQVVLHEDLLAQPAVGQPPLQPLPAGFETVRVNSSVPGFVPVMDLGAGCGTNAPLLYATSLPSIGNTGFNLQVSATPNANLFAFYAFGTGSTQVGVNCFQYLDSATSGTYGFMQADAAGLANIPLPIPATVTPFDLSWQAVQLVPGAGAVLGDFNLSNGVKVRVGATSGCN